VAAAFPNFGVSSLLLLATPLHNTRMRCTILTKRVADTSISMFITAASEVYRQIRSELTRRWQHGTLN